jgi:hypothetical protein
MVPARELSGTSAADGSGGEELWIEARKNVIGCEQGVCLEVKQRICLYKFQISDLRHTCS